MRSRIVLMVLVMSCVAACGGADRETSGTAAPTIETVPLKKLRILVIGGSSGIGLETVKLALDRGHRVTAMARRPERLELRHERLRTFKGDVADEASVNAAIVGHDAVVFTIGIGPTRKPVSVFSDGTRNVIAAMPLYDVGKLVMITGIGAGDSRGHGTVFYDWFLRPVMLKTVYEDKDRSEVLIRDSEVDWTIVRPGFLTDDVAAAGYRVISDLQGIKAGEISRADVAHFVLSVLETGSYSGATVLLTD